MNELTPEKRKQLKIAVILIAIAFFVIYSLVMFFKYDKQTENKRVSSNEQIIFDQPTLQFFQFNQQLNTYPDRITIHAPYLVVVKPDENRSEIYNMTSRRKEKVVNQVILDYFKGDSIYNKQGYVTYFNDKNLGILCDQAFIKSKKEILCITRPDQNKQSNKLITINLDTLEQKDVYSSPNVLTALYFTKGTLYIGEYDFVHNKAFMTVNGKTIPVGDLIKIIYPMGNKMYNASFKSIRNKQTESYYEIQVVDEKVRAKLIEKGKIVFL